MARVVVRAVLPWNPGRTGGCSSFWGRNGFRAGGFINEIVVERRFYYGFVVERTVLLFFGEHGF